MLKSSVLKQVQGLKLAHTSLHAKESSSYSSQVNSMKNTHTIIVIYSHMNKHLVAEAVATLQVFQAPL